MQLEDYEQTKDGVIRFVEDIFRNLVGKILPPMRPRHQYEMTPARDAFMMDFENSCLQDVWYRQSNRRWGFHPLGPKRHENAEWAAMIQSQVFPQHSDVDFQEYVVWVENGGGDEWFQEDEEVCRGRTMEITESRVRDSRCSGCGRDDDFCRCGGGNSIWWG